MLERIVAFSLRQKVIVLLVVALIAAAGMWAFTVLPVEAFPDVLNQTVQVITQMPGQSAQDVERRVTLPLEREFAGIPKVIQKRSVSEFGLSVIYLYFDDGVDGYWARSQTLEKIMSASLPTNAQPNLAPMASVTGEILRYELAGPYSDIELRSIQDWVLEKEFRSVPGVADVISYGGKVRSWSVLIDPLRITNFGFSIRQIADAITGSNINGGGNMIQWPNQSFVVRSEGEFHTRSDVEHVGLGVDHGAVLQVRNIGSVVESNLPLRGIVGRDKRDNIVQGIVLLRKGENPVVVGEAVQQKLDDLAHGNLLPEGVRLRAYYDRTKLVERTTHTVWHNLGEGLILVIVILMIFLRNWRATFIVATVVPLSLLFAFLAIVLFKVPANLVSLGAIDFGMVVDGAVLIVEAVLHHLATRKGKSIAANGAGDGNQTDSLNKVVAVILRPVFFSMIMIIMAYLPIFTLERVEGKMFRPLAWTICFTLAGALFFSIFYIPSLLPWLQKAEEGKDHHEPRWLEWIKNRYLAALRIRLARPQTIFRAVGVVAAIALVTMFFLGSEFLPELDEGALWIRASMPQSTSIEEGQKVAKMLRETLLQQPEVRSVVTQLGGPEDGTDPNLFDNCEVFVDLRPKESWTRFGREREAFIEYLRREIGKIPGIEFNISQPIADNVEEAISGVKGKNAAKIYGPDLGTLRKTADEIVALLKSVPGTSDVGVTAATAMVPHLTVKLDRVKVAEVGLNPQDVNDLIELAVGGRTITQIYDGERRIDVVIRTPEEYRDSLDAIRKLPLTLGNGKRVFLEQVAQVTMEPGPQAIYRENGARRIAVKFGVEGRDLGSVMHDALAKAKDLKLPTGYQIIWGGEYENQQRAMHRLMLVVPMTFLILGFVLFMTFQSLNLVGAVLLNMLISASGGILLLFIRGISFSVSSGVGLLALFGIVALDNVALLSVYKDKKSVEPEALPPGAVRRLLLESCEERFRPVVMTATLAALAILPSAFSHGMGAETQRPLATMVIGGLSTALPATAFFLPAFVEFLETRGFRLRRRTPKSKSAPSRVPSLETGLSASDPLPLP